MARPKAKTPEEIKFEEDSKRIQAETAPKEVVPEEVKAEYEIVPAPAEIIEEPEPITTPKEAIDLDNPKEGDSYIDERGDSHIFIDGTWVVMVGNSATTY